MGRNCVRYFVDPELLRQGVPVEFLEKTNIQELPHAYDAIFSTHEWAAKQNKEQAKKWLDSV